ncbi:peptidase S24 [Paenibacillus chitinolyticus]|uniref:Peptidase S24 n=1 Tax=Paenibacillus chitinolyticus TaxID=79263 RepID=A0A410X3K6_9BACL|nr:peptidase S24 [Paenibacillus chitinolyticus]MCY9593174.1 peptidase S24 [Paenibacillus chitinolyticus]MCY9595309.1 peptidase S24 [Paenibacillus chitinolyticus]QAV21214.1 peptidase S24 [Paenibacillus chitinolyticus]
MGGEAHSRLGSGGFGAEALVVRRALELKGRVEIPSRGTSMRPLIREGSVCAFVPVAAADLRRGDIVLFEGEEGGLIAHRLIRRGEEGPQAPLLCKGDANIGFDPLVPAAKVLARLETISRDGRVSSRLSPGFRIWGRIMTAFPALSRGFRLASRVARRLRGQRN